MVYEYTLKDASVIYTGKTAVSFQLKTTSNIIIRQIILFDVKSSYIVDEDVQEITLQCNLGGSATVESQASDLTFSCNQSFSPAQTINVNIYVNNGSFELVNGVDAPTVAPSDGMAGILNASTSNIPHFKVVYDILDESFYHDSNINDGYFYIDNLAINFGDYVPNTDWYIDLTKKINAGYPYIDGLATAYGDYSEDIEGLLMYRNGVRLKAYKNEVEIIPQRQEV